MIYKLSEYKERNEKPLDTKSQSVVRSIGGSMNEQRKQLAEKILLVLIAMPENQEIPFETLADFACRYADALIKKLNEPEI